MLWECYLFDWCREQDPSDDPTLATVWTGVERLVLEQLPGVDRIVTPAWEELYERDLWQEFLRSRGYRPFSERAFLKVLPQDKRVPAGGLAWGAAVDVYWATAAGAGGRCGSAVIRRSGSRLLASRLSLAGRLHAELGKKDTMVSAVFPYQDQPAGDPGADAGLRGCGPGSAPAWSGCEGEQTPGHRDC